MQMMRFPKAVPKRVGVTRRPTLEAGARGGGRGVTKRETPISSRQYWGIMSFLVLGYALGIVIVEGKLSSGIGRTDSQCIEHVVGACMCWELRRNPHAIELR